MPKRNEVVDSLLLVEAEAREADLDHLRELVEAVRFQPYLGRCPFVRFQLLRQLAMIDVVQGWSDAQIAVAAPALARFGIELLREDPLYGELRDAILARAEELAASPTEPSQALRSLAGRAVHEVGRLLRAGKPAARLAAAGEVLSRAAPKPTRQGDRAPGLLLLPAGLLEAHQVAVGELKRIGSGEAGDG